MNEIIDNYFLRFKNDIAFLELKNDKTLESLETRIIPVIKKDLSEGISTGAYEEHIAGDDIVNAMLYLYAIDDKFKYSKIYRDFLIKTLKDSENYAYIVMRDENENKKFLIIRGLSKIYPDSYKIQYLYASNMWKNAYQLEESLQSTFIRESLKILEENIRNNPKEAINYYETGLINQNIGRYLTAESFYVKALNLTEDEEFKNEIRDKLSQINTKATIEKAVNKMNKADFESAIRLLTNSISHEKRADAFYYLGLCYQNIQQVEKSIYAFSQALEYNADFKELYNDLAVSFYLNGDTREALNTIEEGLVKYKDDVSLLYNRIQINLSLDKTKEAKNDIDLLLSYDDISDEIFNNLMILKEQFRI